MCNANECLGFVEVKNDAHGTTTFTITEFFTDKDGGKIKGVELVTTARVDNNNRLIHVSPQLVLNDYPPFLEKKQRAHVLNTFFDIPRFDSDWIDSNKHDSLKVFIKNYHEKIVKNQTSSYLYGSSFVNFGGYITLHVNKPIMLV